MVDFYNIQASPFHMKGFAKTAKDSRKLMLNSLANMAISGKAVILDIYRKNRKHIHWNGDVVRRLYDGTLANICGVKGINSVSLIRHYFKLDGSNRYESFSPDWTRFFPSEKPLKNPDLTGPDRIFQLDGLKIKWTFI